VIKVRVKDYNKKDAIFEATISLLNEIGFENISMSKIGKAASVSSSTIYVYFDNKEDMLKKVYLDVKKKLASAMLRDIQPDLPIKQVVNRLVRNILGFVREQTGYFLFVEQFLNSPLVEDLWGQEIEDLFQPLFDIFESAIKCGELKQAMPNMLIAYCYQPITFCAKKSVQRELTMTEPLIEQLVQMSWDAVKA
jgi:AcrR family transcriptional regulator